MKVEFIKQSFDIIKNIINPNIHIIKAD